MDGLELIRLVKEQQPSIRIIAISGGGMFDIGSSQLNIAQRLGVDASLSKPFDTSELEAQVHRLLGPAI
jgi:YesN/AraC family two-component response regulator